MHNETVQKYYSNPTDKKSKKKAFRKFHGVLSLLKQGKFILIAVNNSVCYHTWLQFNNYQFSYLNTVTMLNPCTLSWKL